MIVNKWTTGLVLTGLVFLGFACGGGGGGGSASNVTTFNASAAVGDYMQLTLDFDNNTYNYKNNTTGRNETGTFAEDATSKKLTFTADTASGGGLGSATELSTGFVAPNLCIALLANNTGSSADKTSMVFGVPNRNHTTDSLINFVPAGGSAGFLLMQFRDADGGFEVGFADIKENQAVTDTGDVNNNGEITDIINGAPMYMESYSSISGVPDPFTGAPGLVLSTESVNPLEPAIDRVPFLEAAADGSHIILRQWETPNGSPVVGESKLFFNSAMDKIIIDNEFGNAIALERPSSGDWSNSYEGTYYVVAYNADGTPGGIDSPRTPETMVFTFGSDINGGTLSIAGGPQDIPLTKFADMESTLLGNPVSPWSGSFHNNHLNGIFGYQTPAGPAPDLGGEKFFVFSNGVVFFVSAELTGPRLSGGDLDGMPTSYVYGYGGGAKIP